MTDEEKEQAATHLLKGLHTEKWNFATVYREIQQCLGKEYHKGHHQILKRSMLEMLVAKYENEGNV